MITFYQMKLVKLFILEIVETMREYRLYFEIKDNKLNTYIPWELIFRRSMMALIPFLSLDQKSSFRLND